MAKKKEVKMLSVWGETHELIEKIAEKEGRSMRSVVDRMVKKYNSKKGN